MYTLSMFNTGQVTLPKKWRSQFNTNKFIARPKGNTLVLEPIETDVPEGLKDENIEFFEDEKGINIKFKKGVRAGDLVDYMEKNKLV